VAGKPVARHIFDADETSRKAFAFALSQQLLELFSFSVESR
jgi:hypothetical protein